MKRAEYFFAYFNNKKIISSGTLLKMQTRMIGKIKGDERKEGFYV